jgi:hypothetical protein
MIPKKRHPARRPAPAGRFLQSGFPLPQGKTVIAQCLIRLNHPLVPGFPFFLTAEKPVSNKEGLNYNEERPE